MFVQCRLHTARLLLVADAQAGGCVGRHVAAGPGGRPACRSQREQRKGRGQSGARHHPCTACMLAGKCLGSVRPMLTECVAQAELDSRPEGCILMK